MAKRNYSNIAVETTLVSGITDSSSSLTVADASGWPAAPFILIIDQGETKEELILVGAKSGAVFSSLTRGFGGTSGVAHSASAVIKHVVSAEDLALIWNHVHSGAGGDDTAQVDHGGLGGLADDDHSQYHNDARATTWHDADDHSGLAASELPAHDHSGAGEGGAVDHGAITGLGDDDHTQYLKEKASGGTAAEVPEHDHTAAAEGGTLDLDTDAVAWAASLDADDDNFSSPITISWESSEIDLDTDGFWSAGNPTRFTVPSGKAGIYHVDIGVTVFNAEWNEELEVRILKNGTIIAEGRSQTGDSAVDVSKFVQVSRVLPLSVNDFLEIQVADVTAGGADLKGAATEKLTWFDGFRIGASP